MDNLLFEYKKDAAKHGYSYVLWGVSLFVVFEAVFYFLYKSDVGGFYKLFWCSEAKHYYPFWTVASSDDDHICDSWYWDQQGQS